MKHPNIQRFKNPRWLAILFPLGLILVGCLGLLGCNVLNHFFPPSDPKDLFGGFATLAILFIFSIIIGLFCLAICSVGLLIAALTFPFRQKDPK